MEGDNVKNPRGRPVGHRLSEETKEKIRIGRLGSNHTTRTKDKISKSLSAYFKKRDSLADSIEQEYNYISDEAARWIADNREEIDDEEYATIMTEKRLSYLKQIEICMGSDIEHLFGHNTTPELLLMLKEQIQKSCSPEALKEFYSLI